MIGKLKIHHIAVCTDDIDKTADLYRKLGYAVSDTVIDEAQHVYVKFCKLGEVKIELVGMIDDTSPIARILTKVGVSAYHICYEVNNIETAIKQFRLQGYIPVTRKAKSTIDGRHVIFLYHRNNCLTELIEINHEI